jgi:hypothetical protein
MGPKDLTEVAASSCGSALKKRDRRCFAFRRARQGADISINGDHLADQFDSIVLFTAEPLGENIAKVERIGDRIIPNTPASQRADGSAGAGHARKISAASYRAIPLSINSSPLS